MDRCSSPQWRSKALVAACTLGVLLALNAAPLAACTIDAIPSATAAGRTAVIYDIAPGSVDPAHYAPFVFPGSFGAGWTIRFGELAQGLKLTPHQLHARWSWSFGDGTQAWGHSVTHAYRSPGQYVVTVQAHDPYEQYPVQFDRILVRVLAPGQILATEGPNLLNGSRFDSGAALFGGLLQLRQEADKGLISAAGARLTQIQSGAWASIRDYWRHTHGSLPSPYAHVDALLRQESAALNADDQYQAETIADQLPHAWTGIGSRVSGIAWLPIAIAAVAILVAAVVANEVRGWRKLARQERLRNARTV